MKKRLAAIVISAALAVSMTACEEDSQTANAAGQLTTEIMEVADLPELTAEDREREEPETEIKGELTADNTDKGSGDEAAANTGTDKPTASNTSSTSSAGAFGNKTSGASGNAAATNNTASTTGNNSSGTPGGSSAGNAGSSSGSIGTTAPAAQEHVHTWVTYNATGHYEEQIVKAAWDEPVYEMQEKSICNVCGQDITGNTTEHSKNHALAYEGSGYHSEWVKVQTNTIHHEAETAQVWVEDAPGYTECSGCGERSIAINHNH